MSTNALNGWVKNAKSSIEIQTLYLITTELSQNLFRAALERGVTVRILTNGFPLQIMFKYLVVLKIIDK